ncbi:CamS family sex pheromone protein [Oceanobacillus bengalensis]|uniref:CamS family sex pheromone protein n=1 Tax=Oceanobacillus bengalensis TaxID=1435466 RepID=A0A494YTE2_9BACI|nr:CamS family sex pheromone protein [Oceanobacillus bengalensis]RKQ13345.1 CamS family sex pheromone protein [Oceanobacillus bengalensis]
MKNKIIALLCAIILLAGCVPNNSEDEEVLQNDEEGTEQQTFIVPSNQLSNETYPIILPYETSEARGVITNQMANRVDIDEMEQGLMRHSKEVFDPEKLYFQEGQYLTTDDLFSWIDGLNPARLTEEEQEDMDQEEKIDYYEENPRYLSHILEQNYLKRKEKDNTVEVELEGMSIGIALKSVYRFQTETGGPYYYEDIPMKEMLEKGKEYAQTLVTNIREKEGLADIPIMVALYREEDQNSPVPGNFVAKTTVNTGDVIGEWETINEEYILFPSDEASKEYLDDYELVNSFGNEIAQFFPNYVGFIGEGFYIDKELQKLVIDIPLEFYGKTEVTGFTQYTYGLVQDMFSNYYDLEINVTSSNGAESLIFRNAGDESPTIHIYD